MNQESWHPSLREDASLGESLKQMEPFKLNQEDVPLIIKIVENPKYDIGLFAGNVSLCNHDCIHALLGRGLLLKDEAFVIGYTMGSTKKMRRWRRNLYMFCAKYLFSESYRFGEEERFVFNMGVKAGSLSEIDLSIINFKKYFDYKISDLRERLGVDEQFLTYCYEIEKKCFPNSPESQRLL